MKRPSRPITIYTPSLSVGGIGRNWLHIMEELHRRGIPCDLVVTDDKSPLMEELPPSARVFRVGTTHELFSLPSLARYLLARGPAGILTDRLRLNRAVIRAGRMVGRRPPIIMSFHNPVSLKLDTLPPKRRRRFERKLRWCVGPNRRIVAVSQGVAQDLVERVGFPRDKVVVVPNPVVTPRLLSMAQEPVDHPFFREGCPVIVTAARMTEQKDFSTLLKAFRALCREMEARLVILGTGKYFDAVAREVEELGLGSKVAMLGFHVNPYKFMARAGLFVLSSRWEGFGNVLVEALACGTPVVATDCPVGPREVLEGGRLGSLVPVGDVAAMKEAMADLLMEPPDPGFLKSGVEKYTAERSTNGYLAALGLLRSQGGR